MEIWHGDGVLVTGGEHQVESSLMPVRRACDDRIAIASFDLVVYMDVCKCLRGTARCQQKENQQSGENTHKTGPIQHDRISFHLIVSPFLSFSRLSSSHHRQSLHRH